MPLKAESLRPLSDNLIVRPTKADEKTPGGIYIPDAARDGKMPTRGTVIAVGTGRMLDDGTIIPVAIEVGDEIVFEKYGTNEIEVDEEKLLIVCEQHVHAIVAAEADGDTTAVHQCTSIDEAEQTGKPAASAADAELKAAEDAVEGK